MPDSEPLAGITDAMEAGQEFFFYASGHRDRPENETWRQQTLDAARALIAALQALGDQAGDGRG